MLPLHVISVAVAIEMLKINLATLLCAPESGRCAADARTS